MFETSLSKLKSKDQTTFEIHHIYPQNAKVFTKGDELVKTCFPALPAPDVVPPGPEHLLGVRVAHHSRHEGGAEHSHDVSALLLFRQRYNPEK